MCNFQPAYFVFAVGVTLHLLLAPVLLILPVPSIGSDILAPNVPGLTSQQRS
ncbi:unnamed protein product [Allacma fusca]|uniref:Uncharacterized protein n=1 Tax=Allacma fusca TaxID=39272 RepID=A0A8J2NZ15_9HEXA|nr:unnamed protein product [Allacma fusca]